MTRPATRRSTTPSRRRRRPRCPTTTSTARSSAASGAEAGGADWQTIMYEGYAPGGVAVLIECLTDNRNRAAAEVRTALTRNGGSWPTPASVSYVFNRKGVVIVPKERRLTEDDLLEVVLDAGAEEVNDLGEAFEIITEASDFVAVRTALQAAGIDYESAEASFVPDLQVELDADGAQQDVPASSTRSRTATTCRTSTPTATSPTSPGRARTRTQDVAATARTPRRRGSPAPPCRPAAGVALSPNTCSDVPRRSTATEQADAGARARRRPRADPLRPRRRRGRARPAAARGRRRRRPHRRTTTTAASGCSRSRPSIEAGSTAPPRRRRRRAGLRQHNVRTVMGTAQARAVAMLAAARRGLPVALHTPSEVKAAVTGSGRADKAQVDRDGHPAAAARPPRPSRPTPPTPSRWRSATSGAAAAPATRLAAAAVRGRQPPRRWPPMIAFVQRPGRRGRPRTRRSSRSAASGCSCSARPARWPACGVGEHGAAGHLAGRARGLADAVRLRRRRRAGRLRAAADRRPASGRGWRRRCSPCTRPTRCAARSPPRTSPR